MDDFIPTRATKNRKNIESVHSATTFEARKPLPKKDVENVEKVEKIDREKEREKQEKEMKRYRYEVMKFGISGFQKKKALDAKVALAVSLGAKPYKNKKQNYKDLKLQRERAKIRTAQVEKTLSGLDASLLRQGIKKKVQIKKSSGILGVYGNVTKDTIPSKS